jgi:hypothetical protein
MTRRLAVICCLALLTGCSKFQGEWIEEGRVNHEGQYIRTEGPRRMALKFEPISTVYAGAYVDEARVVDSQAVTNDTYVTMQNGDVAQFGSMIARVNGNHLVTYVGAEEGRRFVRYKGPSIFPPRVWIPSLESSQ